MLTRRHTRTHSRTCTHTHTYTHTGVELEPCAGATKGATYLRSKGYRKIAGDQCTGKYEDFEASQAVCDDDSAASKDDGAKPGGSSASNATAATEKQVRAECLSSFAFSFVCVRARVRACVRTTGIGCADSDGSNIDTAGHSKARPAPPRPLRTAAAPKARPGQVYDVLSELDGAVGDVKWIESSDGFDPPPDRARPASAAVV